MTNTELVRQLCVASVQADDMRLRDFGYLMKTAAEKIDELLGSVETLDNLTDLLMECVPQWIPVTDRLPKPQREHQRRVNVLAAYDTGSVLQVTYEFYEWSKYGVGFQTDFREHITHWMPLPNPPAKGREE